MKKISIICFALLASTVSQAQKKGFLNKLGEQLEQSVAVANGEVSEKELKKDIESKTLDSKPINKDSRGISGIYYSVYPVQIGIVSTGVNYSKKFLINYFEGDNVNQIEIATRHFYEKRKDIFPLVYSPMPGTPDYFPVTTSTKMGHLLIDGVTDQKYGQRGSTYYSMMNTVLYFNKPDGNYLGSAADWRFHNDDILELEEGMLVTTNLEYIVKANTPEKYKFLQENGTYNLFYKKEKEEKALAMTKAEVWDKMKAFYTKYHAAFKAAEGSNVELVKPIAKFKDEPSNADIVKTVKARMASMPHFSEELVYLYPVTAWENRFENVGLLGRTLTHRVFQVQAVIKKDGECQMLQFMIRQDNTYKGGSNAENFTGNPVQAIGDTHKTVINCNNGMKYKK